MKPRQARLSIRDLQCSAGKRVLFDQLNLDLFDGQCLLLLGPNGSGKTTLLRSLTGLTRPTGGTISWQAISGTAGNDPKRRITSSDDERDARSQICPRLYQGHNSGWKAELSARENLILQSSLDNSGSESAFTFITTGPARIQTALERAGIGAQAELAFGRLSAGQRRRLALARLMVDSRMIWLLDEPATALDEQGLRLLAELIDQKLADDGLVITATHQNLGLKHTGITLDLAAHERLRA